MYKKYAVHSQDEFDKFVGRLTRKQLDFVRVYLSMPGERTTRRLMMAALAGGYASEPGERAWNHGAWLMSYSRAGAIIRSIEKSNGFTPDRSKLDERLCEVEALR